MRESVEKKIQGVRVVPLGRKITEQEGPQKALEEGRKAGANLVLWGYYNSFYRGQVHIELIKTPRQLHLLKGEYDLNPPSAERKGLTVEEDLSAELSYTVLLMIGLTRFEVEEYAAAIDCYNQALKLRNTPEQLVDQLDIYLQRGEAWLYLEEKESFFNPPSNGRNKGGGGFYVGGHDFPPNQFALDNAIADFTTVITNRPDSSSVLFDRAFAYAREGDYQQALNDYNNILRSFPNEAQAYIGRGVVYNLLENYDQAIADYNEAEKLIGQKDIGLYYNRAISFGKKKEFQQALDDYNRVLALEQGHIDSKINRASIYAKLGYYQSAVKELGNALNDVPPSAFYYSVRGNAWMEIGETEKALSDFNALISLVPTSTTGYHNRGHLYWNMGRLDEAITEFSKVISLDPRADYAYNDRATCQVIKGNYSEALSDYAVAVKFRPDWGPSWFNQGEAHRSLKQYQLAIMDLTKATEINFKEKYLAYYLRAQTKSEAGDYLGAIDDYALAIKEQPGDIDIWLGKAATWMKVKKYALAMRDYRTGLSLEMAFSDGAGVVSRGEIYRAAISNLTDAIKNNPSDDDGYVARCLAYILSQDYESALKDINVAVTLNSTSGESYLLQGNLLASLKRYDEAGNSYNQSIALTPNSARSWYYRGVAYADQKKCALAIEDFSNAINLAPDFVAPRIRRGRCCGEQHDFKLAITDSDSVLKTDPTNDEALLLRGLANADMGNRQEAITDLRRAYNLAHSTSIREAAAAELSRLRVSPEAELLQH
jgi:tetratricopeptide (TPR) repeat protein